MEGGREGRERKEVRREGGREGGEGLTCGHPGWVSGRSRG